MRNFKSSVLLILIAVTMLFAGNVVLIPNNVKEVKSVTFSSGGGKTAIIYAKIFCEMNDGTNILFNAPKTSVSGAFGFGRFTIPEVIQIKKANVQKAKWQ